MSFADRIADSRRAERVTDLVLMVGRKQVKNLHAVFCSECRRHYTILKLSADYWVRGTKFVVCEGCRKPVFKEPG